MILRFIFLINFNDKIYFKKNQEIKNINHLFFELQYKI
jgi:hypothetical protein